MNPLKKSIDYFYTHCIDSNFTRHKKQYLFQCFLASGVVFIVLLLLNFVTSTAVISAIGATTFIAFAFPDKKSAQAKYIIRGYFVGIIVGTLAYFLASYHPLFIHSPLVTLEKEILGAFAVGLSMFFDGDLRKRTSSCLCCGIRVSLR